MIFMEDPDNGRTLYLSDVGFNIKYKIPNGSLDLTVPWQEAYSICAMNHSCLTADGRYMAASLRPWAAAAGVKVRDPSDYDMKNGHHMSDAARYCEELHNGTAELMAMANKAAESLMKGLRLAETERKVK